MTAEQLFDEAQALMRSLPSNIGKAKAAGRLTPRQTANLARLDEIEKILPQGSPEWQRIWTAQRASYDERLAAQRAEFGEAQAAKAEAAGFRIGDRVSYFAPSWLPGVPGTKHGGKVKQSVSGGVYVASRGQRLDLFRNPWSPDR